MADAKWTSEDTNYQGGTRFSTVTINGTYNDTEVLIINPKAETRFTVDLGASESLGVEVSVAKDGSDGLVPVYKDGSIVAITTDYNDVFAAGITGLKFTGATTNACVIRVAETVKGLV